MKNFIFKKIANLYLGAMPLILIVFFLIIGFYFLESGASNAAPAAPDSSNQYCFCKPDVEIVTYDIGVAAGENLWTRTEDNTPQQAPQQIRYFKNPIKKFELKPLREQSLTIFNGYSEALAAYILGKKGLASPLDNIISESATLASYVNSFKCGSAGGNCSGEIRRSSFECRIPTKTKDGTFFLCSGGNLDASETQIKNQVKNLRNAIENLKKQLEILSKVEVQNVKIAKKAIINSRAEINNCPQFNLLNFKDMETYNLLKPEELKAAKKDNALYSTLYCGDYK